MPAPLAVEPDATVLTAWSRLGQPRPRGVVPVRVRGGASQVLRLTDVPALGDVVAKCAGRAETHREAVVLRDVLPAAGVRALACHGVADDSSGRPWVFVAAAPGAPLVEAADARVALAGAAAELHQRTVPAPGAALPRGHAVALPDRATALAADAQRAALRVPVAAAVVERLATALAAALPLLADADNRLRTMRPCLTHGDLVPKNAHRGEDGLVWLYDWETATYGPPVVDLAEVDLRAYHAAYGTAGPGGPWWGSGGLAAAARIGRLARLLDAAGWALDGLLPDWPDRPVGQLAHYADALSGEAAATWEAA